MKQKGMRSAKSIVLLLLILSTMGLFGFFKKTAAPQPAAEISGDNPYKDSATNRIYNLLFCDDLELLKASIKPPYNYPFDVLFFEESSATDLQKIIDEKETDPRIKMHAYNKQLAMGHKPTAKELLAVIVEVGLEGGLDVLASFKNGTARYINQTGKIIIWEQTDDEQVNKITRDLFLKSEPVVSQIGPWDKPRKQHPARGMARISFLVSDGLYFGEAPVNDLFNDKLAKPALLSATRLMQYLTEKVWEKKPQP